MQYDVGASSVIYRSRMTHGENKRNCQIFSPLEFITSITQHIPEQYFQVMRWYGRYNNPMHGDRKKLEVNEKEKGAGESEKARGGNIVGVRK